MMMGKLRLYHRSMVTGSSPTRGDYCPQYGERLSLRAINEWPPVLCLIEKLPLKPLPSGGSFGPNKGVLLSGLRSLHPKKMLRWELFDTPD